jgi:hypothetical protein
VGSNCNAIDLVKDIPFPYFAVQRSWPVLDDPTHYITPLHFITFECDANAHQGREKFSADPKWCVRRSFHRRRCLASGFRRWNYWLHGQHPLLAIQGERLKSAMAMI